LVLVDEGGRIVTVRHDQSDRPVGSFVLVDIEESLAKCVDGYAYDGVGLGVEFGPPSKCLGGDCVFLDLIRPALEVFLADVSKDPPQVVRSAKNAGSQKPFDLLPFRIDRDGWVRDILRCCGCSHGSPFYAQSEWLSIIFPLGAMERLAGRMGAEWPRTKLST
jgi:hypothetical protein